MNLGISKEPRLKWSLLRIPPFLIFPEPLTAEATQEIKRGEGLGGEEAGSSHESGSAVISGGEGMPGESVAVVIYSSFKPHSYQVGGVTPPPSGVSPCVG